MFSQAELRELMALRSKSGLKKLLFWKKNPRFSRGALQADLENLIEFYRREGFLDARIDTVITRVNEAESSVALSIVIHEGEPLRIGQVKFNLLVQADSEPARVQQLFLSLRRKHGMQAGARYRDEIVLQTRELFSTEFSNHGSPFITVQPVLRVHEQQRLVDVVLEIDTGPLCRFGRAFVSGNETTPAALILRQLGFREGDIYSQDALARSQRQIYQLGVFQFVTLRLQVNNRNQSVLPIHVVVKEAPRLTLKLGTGYGREDAIRVFSDMRRLNFLGGARRLELFAKHSRLEPINIHLRLIQPSFLSPKMSLSLNPFFRTENEVAYKINRIGANLNLHRKYGKFSEGTLSYSLERDNLDISQETRATALDSSQIEIYNKSSITLILTRDTSRPIFEPRRGIFRALTLTYSGFGFEDDFQFVRAVLEGRRYQTLNGNLVAAARLKIGTIIPVGPSAFIPIEERFYSGGSNSVRGWARFQLGPKNTSGTPIGGNSLVEGSVELRFPIWDRLSGVTFVDFGNAWRRENEYHLKELKFAAGTGLRVKTLIGPIRMDLGFPLGFRKGGPQFHLSVGHAF